MILILGRENCEGGLPWIGLERTIYNQAQHRKIHDGIFEICEVPPKKIRTITSAVDKLVKSPWAEVRKKMAEEKGLAEEVADTISEYVYGRVGRTCSADYKQMRS